jgi:hypothetical protein
MNEAPWELGVYRKNNSPAGLHRSLLNYNDNWPDLYYFNDVTINREYFDFGGRNLYYLKLLN